ncbi:hypothetical protein Nepgr_012284 [Nepenthes gracilis]|uniref:GRPD C-terminal domain-containing protein n=1 Tax=Nepenthes gracilis TaxID=150966 RepID=A0AAD3SFQ9_NEPGR|nr:hypothetical protein Nepgr_012284 [Nepenthes gracilis]
MSETSAGVSESSSTRSLSQISEEEEPFRQSIDLVAAARRNISFLRNVSGADWLQQRPALDEAIRRYDQLWMPLISHLTVGATPPMIVPPLDVEWIWYCHTLNPVYYRQYCEAKFSKLIGKPAIFDEENEEYAFHRCREIWVRQYPNEPYENELGLESQVPVVKNGMLLGEVLKQRNLYSKFSLPYMSEVVYLIAARRRYKKFLCILQRFAEGCSCLVPTSDILLMWLTHQSYPTVYAADMRHTEREMVKVVGPCDKVREEDIEETKHLWETTFDQPYEKAGGRIAVEWNGCKPVIPPACWMASDFDVNVIYKSMQPRFLLEACVSVRLNSQVDAIHADKRHEFLRLRFLRCHRELKIDKPISLFPPDSWQNAWNLYCEFGTRGIRLELRQPGSLCFKGAGLLDNVSVTWNDLLRAPSLTIGREIDQKVRCVTSITPPVQAPYLLKCVPDRVTDDSGAMISDVILKLNQYRPQEGRWLSRTVLDHVGRECFVVRTRVGGGFWRRGGEAPHIVKWEDRIIEIREGPWSYVAGSVGKVPEKVVGTAKPKGESKERMASWHLSTGDELMIQWESTSFSNLNFTLNSQDSPNSIVKLLRGRKMQYQSSNEDDRSNRVEEQTDEEEGFVTLVRVTDESPSGKATALLNWKLLAVEFMPEEDAVLVLLLCVAILRTVSEMRKEDVGGLLIRRRLKEAQLGVRDWGSLVLDPSSSCPPISSPHLQPWYRNAKAVMARDGIDQTVWQPALNYSLVEGDDKLFKQGILS